FAQADSRRSLRGLTRLRLGRQGRIGLPAPLAAKGLSRFREPPRANRDAARSMGLGSAPRASKWFVDRLGLADRGPTHRVPFPTSCPPTCLWSSTDRGSWPPSTLFVSAAWSR